MGKHLLSVLFLLIAINITNAFGQDSSAFFTRTYGDTLNDMARYAELTSDGGLIITGYHTVPRDTTCNIWVIRTNSGGDTLWTSSFGTPYYDVGYCVKETSDKHFVVCGVWTDHDNYDPNDFSGDVFVSLLSPEGTVLWTWLYADGNTELNGGANYILEDTDGNFILTGGMRHVGYNKKHAFLLKLNRTSQTVMWNKIYPSEDYVSYTTTVLKTPEDNGFIITGLIYPLENHDCDVYLVKTNSLGDTLWTNTIDEPGDFEARHMAACSDGGYIITGNTAIPPSSKRMAYILKVDNQGYYLWHNLFPSPYPNIPSSGFGVLQTPDDGFALTGYFPFTETNSQDLLLLKTDHNGDLLWMKGFGEELYDKGYSIALSDKGIILAGYKKMRSGDPDVFLLHTDFDGILSSNNDFLEQFNDKKLFSIYPNPASSVISIQLGTGNRRDTYLRPNSRHTIKLYDLNGSKLIERNITVGMEKIDIDVSSLNSGVYFIQMTTENKIATIKILLL